MYGKRLIGKTDMEDALKKLDQLTQEEARMIVAENLRATHAVDERVMGVTERVAEVIHGVPIIFRRSRYAFDPEQLRRKGNNASHETSRTLVIS